MRSPTLLFLFVFAIPSTVFSQTGETKWTSEYGLSKNIMYPNFNGIDLRFISPPFQITTADHYWTEEEEKHPEKFKKARMLLEFLFVPPFSLPQKKNTNVAKIYIPSIVNYIPGLTKAKTDSSFYYVANTIKLSELTASLNFQCRIIQYKRLSLQGTLGFKFFFLMSPENGLINFNKLFYFNLGLLAQLNLGLFLPFVDIGIDRIYTIGTELKLHSIFRKEGKRYKLHFKKK